MIKIIIQKITPYEQTVIMWRDPADPEKMHSSKYDFPEEKRDSLVSHLRPTGKIDTETKEIYSQTIDPKDEDEKSIVEEVVKAVNEIID